MGVRGAAAAGAAVDAPTLPPHVASLPCASFVETCTSTARPSLGIVNGTRTSVCVSGGIVTRTGSVRAWAPSTRASPDIVAGVAPEFWNLMSSSSWPPFATAFTLVMLTSAVGAPCTLIAIGNAASPGAATSRLSAARAAWSTRATSPAATAPGSTFSGGVTVSATRTLAPGSRVVTTSDNVSHDAGPPGDASFA